jgi:hypothetical protein
MAEYQVEWLMDITADTPLEAAEKAHAIMLDRFSEAVVFKITDQADGTETILDLMDNGGEPEDEPEDEPTYTVWCYFQDPATPKRSIDTGLTLEQAQAICQDPDTSSSTTTTREGKARTERYGSWFYGYTEE